jgi:thioester reductase-like protein/acyl carrier protein
LKVILAIEGGVRSQKQVPTKQPQPTTTAPAPAPIPAKRAPQVHAPSISASKDSEVSSAVPGSSQSETLAKALLIVAEESGLAAADMTDGIVFADVGIDSLLGLTISARIKEDLDADIDFNALLFECPTLGDLKASLGAGGSDATTSTGTLTPTSNSTDSTSIGGDALGTQEGLLASKFDFKRALQVISEESGVAAEDLTDDTIFADAGVDSLLSLVIVSRFRDELELDIPQESLFLECPTVADLKTALLGDIAQESSSINRPPAVSEQSKVSEGNGPVQLNQADTAALKSRARAVDELVRKYTIGFSGPVSPSASSPTPKDDEKVVLVTGASGSLGSHLAYHIVQRPDVKTVVCLNRHNRQEPFKRQIKAMRDKGIRFPEALNPKLVVLQTDTSKPMLGLGSAEYERLVSSVTHLIHSAWPMTAKRALQGFESQFQVMQNLIQLACDVASQRPLSFKFSFQMVSSIGVVGLYGKHNGQQRTLVPEERFGVETILNNGYGDAKWGCERMIDETLHKHPDRFRPMVVRLGQIAGSKTSGYWNPMEHFGFLVKSSQALNALPDVPGEVFWTPVNDMADTLTDLVLGDHIPYRFYHLENPMGKPWSEVNAILADAVGITNLIPFEEWVERVRAAPQRNNPAATLMEFWDDNYIRMSCGGLVLDAKHTLEHSKSLNAVGPVSEEVVRKYIHIWKEIGFLSQ